MKFDSKTTHFTSDLHLYHKNILKYNRDTRDGTDEKSMVDILVGNWNSKIGKDDTTFILGDVTFGTVEDTLATLNSLNGKKFLILGNHDHKIYKSPELMGCFEWVFSYKEITIDDKFVVLMHYPIESWNKCHYGSIHLHGHVHGHFGNNNLTNRFDVGVDNRKDKLMIPFTWDEIKQRLTENEPKVSTDFERRTA